MQDNIFGGIYDSKTEMTCCKFLELHIIVDIITKNYIFLLFRMNIYRVLFIYFFFFIFLIGMKFE